MRKTEGQKTTIVKRKSPVAERQKNPDSPNHIRNQGNVTALKKRISLLEAENTALREQVATLANGPSRPVQSYRESIREQQHNFFKYSNARRY